MGAHVWKRDGGTSAAKGVERDNEAGVTPGTATESAGTEAADAENPPPKRQRVEPPATSCQGPNTTGVPGNQFSSVAAPAAAAGVYSTGASTHGLLNTESLPCLLVKLLTYRLLRCIHCFPWLLCSVGQLWHHYQAIRLLTNANRAIVTCAAAS